MNMRFLLAPFLLAAPLAFCQQPGNPPAPASAPQGTPNQYGMAPQGNDGGQGDGMDGGHRWMNRHQDEADEDEGADYDGPVAEDEEVHALHVGLPEGEFWRNPELVAQLGLTPEQVRRLEDITLQAKIQMVQMDAAVEVEELRIEPLLNGPTFDPRQVQAQVDKIADARAAIEKADARALLETRAVLTPDQIAKLKMSPNGRGMGPRGFRGGEMHGPGDGQKSVGPPG